MDKKWMTFGRDLGVGFRSAWSRSWSTRPERDRGTWGRGYYLSKSIFLVFYGMRRQLHALGPAGGVSFCTSLGSDRTDWIGPKSLEEHFSAVRRRGPGRRFSSWCTYLVFTYVMHDLKRFLSNLWVYVMYVHVHISVLWLDISSGWGEEEKCVWKEKNPETWRLQLNK